ncbi:MAG: hypothetical protein ABWX83_00825, partial [Luteibacter sp.]
LEASGAYLKFVAPQLGRIPTTGDAVEADFSFRTGDSVLFDAIFIPGGRKSVDALKRQGDDLQAFIRDGWRHCKPLAASGEAAELLAGLPGIKGGKALRSRHGVVVSADRASDAMARSFVRAIADGRHWVRETLV